MTSPPLHAAAFVSSGVHLRHNSHGLVLTFLVTAPSGPVPRADQPTLTGPGFPAFGRVEPRPGPTGRTFQEFPDGLRGFRFRSPRGGPPGEKPGGPKFKVNPPRKRGETFFRARGGNPVFYPPPPPKPGSPKPPVKTRGGGDPGGFFSPPRFFTGGPPFWGPPFSGPRGGGGGAPGKTPPP